MKMKRFGLSSVICPNYRTWKDIQPEYPRHVYVLCGQTIDCCKADCSFSFLSWENLRLFPSWCSMSIVPSVTFASASIWRYCLCWVNPFLEPLSSPCLQRSEIGNYTLLFREHHVRPSQLPFGSNKSNVSSSLLASAITSLHFLEHEFSKQKLG
jgi:hypothetical protein